jgi:hypothetical protein
MAGGIGVVDATPAALGLREVFYHFTAINGRSPNPVTDRP